jgi:DNA-binding CsgD family transcriptional regulator
LADVREAHRLSVADPDSAAHALATAELAHAELWHGIPSGPGHARQAVRLARAAGADRALAFALVAEVMARLFAGADGRPEQALEAQAAAARARDFWAFLHATLWAANASDPVPGRAMLDLLRRGREQAMALGAPPSYVARHYAVEAEVLLAVGDWRECARCLRIALGTDAGPFSNTVARLNAAQLACRQGRIDEAQAHLERAEELFRDLSRFLALHFDSVRTELAVAAGDTETATGSARVGLTSAVQPAQVERLLPLAARALADRAERIRDRGHDPAADIARLAELRREFPAVVSDAGLGHTESYRNHLNAMQAWYDAEVQRAEPAAEAASAWRDAADRCRIAGLSWDEAYCSRREAEVVLRSGSRGEVAVDTLRRAHRLAESLQAGPLIADLETLAAGARVTLHDQEVRPVPVTDLPGLTSREREILDFIAAGRTYAQVARALVISEKTVSAHVSNLLRKTGTANRIELAQLAHRVRDPHRPPGSSTR